MFSKQIENTSQFVQILSTGAKGVAMKNDVVSSRTL